MIEGDVSFFIVAKQEMYLLIYPKNTTVPSFSSKMVLEHTIMNSAQ